MNDEQSFSVLSDTSLSGKTQDKDGNMNDSILRTLSTLAMVQNERLKLARKYDIVSLQGSTAYIKKVVWEG